MNHYGPWNLTTGPASASNMPSMAELQRMTRDLTKRARAAELATAVRVQQMVCGLCGFQATYKDRRIQLCPCMVAELRSKTEALAPGPIGQPAMIQNPLNAFYGIPIEVVEPKGKPE